MKRLVIAVLFAILVLACVSAQTPYNSPQVIEWDAPISAVTGYEVSVMNMNDSVMIVLGTTISTLYPIDLATVSLSGYYRVFIRSYILTVTPLGDEYAYSGYAVSTRSADCAGGVTFVLVNTVPVIAEPPTGVRIQ